MFFNSDAKLQNAYHFIVALFGEEFSLFVVFRYFCRKWKNKWNIQTSMGLFLLIHCRSLIPYDMLASKN